MNEELFIYNRRDADLSAIRGESEKDYEKRHFTFRRKH